jgi:hypothetical protein
VSRAGPDRFCLGVLEFDDLQTKHSMACAYEAGPSPGWAAVVGGISAVTTALVSLGIPRDSAVKYEAEVKADKFVMVVHGGRA